MGTKERDINIRQVHPKGRDGIRDAKVDGNGAVIGGNYCNLNKKNI